MHGGDDCDDGGGDCGADIDAGTIGADSTCGGGSNDDCRVSHMFSVTFLKPLNNAHH